MTTIELGGWLQTAVQRLTGTEAPLTIASALVAHFLDKPRSWVLAHPEHPLDEADLLNLQPALERLAAGTPLPYITGEQSFRGHSFMVDPSVLIPRPETELLVERALEWMERQSRPLRVLDVGTGSGCIAISLARESSQAATVFASDISWQSLRIARQNAHRLETSITLIQTDLLGGLSGPFDLICANLPYIPSADLPALDVSRWEPALALDGGERGSELIEALLLQARSRLAPGGLLLAEMEYRQGERLARAARIAFPLGMVIIHPDLAGQDRLLSVALP